MRDNMWIKLIFKKKENQIKKEILELKQKYERIENIVINDVKKDISELKIDVKILKTDITELKTDFKILISRFDNFEKNFYKNKTLN
ncbi:MAG: hypothetical protein HPAVJP_4020 [Candidatus Hepatoplasma vulgare]|nr:MAG: hypothetical protein HPAVJP_4020 [Candidatus Hepatoplasma sp.]